MLSISFFRHGAASHNIEFVVRMIQDLEYVSNLDIKACLNQSKSHLGGRCIFFLQTLERVQHDPI